MFEKKLKLKFKKIKNWKVAKEIFAVLSTCMKEDYLYSDLELQPMHEIYDVILENVEKGSNLQFYTELYKTTIGVVIASEMTYFKDYIMINSMCVVPKYRHNGFTGIMLDELEERARKNGAKKMFINYTKISRDTFLKHDFSLRLEILFKGVMNDEIKEKIDKLPLMFLESHFIDNKTFMLFSADSINPTLLRRITKEIPSSKAKYMFEKEL